MKNKVVNMSTPAACSQDIIYCHLPARDDTEQYQRQKSLFLGQLMDGGTPEGRKGGRRMMIFDGGAAD
jgi:hypothetical protein